MNSIVVPAISSIAWSCFFAHFPLMNSTPFYNREGVKPGPKGPAKFVSQKARTYNPGRPPVFERHTQSLLYADPNTRTPPWPKTAGPTHSYKSTRVSGGFHHIAPPTQIEASIPGYLSSTAPPPITFPHHNSRIQSPYQSGPQVFSPIVPLGWPATPRSDTLFPFYHSPMSDSLQRALLRAFMNADGTPIEGQSLVFFLSVGISPPHFMEGLDTGEGWGQVSSQRYFSHDSSLQPSSREPALACLWF